MKNQVRSSKKGPCMVELKAKQKYLWCSCGLSKNQPFCDGSHHKTSKLPIELQFEEDLYISLCGCKLTSGAPYCDGSHRSIIQDD